MASPSISNPRSLEPTLTPPTPGLAHGRDVHTHEHYLNTTVGWKSWLFSLDHKRIGILYLVSISLMFFLGGMAASLVRFNLLEPQGLLGAEAYNRSFTAHGVIMVFFFLIPSIPAVQGNFFLPLMLGVKDVAFPKLNLMSWYLYMIGAIMTIIALLLGGIDTGWTFYTPYSSLYANGAIAWVVVGIFITGFSSILTGLNFIVTIHKMRAPGLTWFRLPLFVWSMYATSLIQVLGTPVVAITLLLVTVEKVFHVGIFDPKLGGDPVLFQHFFWFYSHPAVYIMILPGMAVVSEIIACFSRKTVFGYKFIAFSSLAIAVLGFLVWGHHLFVSSQSPYAGMVFSVISFLVAVPSAIKVFNWTATLYKGSIRLQTPMLYALGFIGLFTVGGLTGLPLASLATDVHLHDTYYVIAHFHYIMVGAAVMAYLGGLHYWWPKMTGRMYPEAWGRTAALVLFVGFNLTFGPQFLLGMWGMNRRYHSYAPEYQVLNEMSTLGASIQLIGYALPLFYLLWSLKYGQIAGPNPWGATGLEWQTPSPPPTTNFEKTPIVTTGPYVYSAIETERAEEDANAAADAARMRVVQEEQNRNVEPTELI
ncbi:MAG: cytochrome c oxidase subunit [Abditibacteriota bacterium]|nr:cytochrome c oxidase subunit [Abditibacteriota bacterium]